MRMKIVFREISSLEAQSMILDEKTDNLYFATEYLLPKKYVGGHQPRGFSLSEMFRYGSRISKLLVFRPKANPKNILGPGEDYLNHKWFIKEGHRYNRSKPPLIKD